MELVSRLDNVIKKDKKINPQYMKDVIKSDLYYLLNNYFNVNFDGIDLTINVSENNMYAIDIRAVGDRLKSLQILPNNTPF